MKTTLLVTFAALLALSACNTVDGMGKDVSAGGDAVSHTADEVQDKM